MARPRTPTRLLELKGAFRKDPQRRRPGSPVPAKPIGDAPDRLPAAARPYWRELVDLMPAGVLGSSDRWCCELAARLMEKASRQLAASMVLELVKAAGLSAEETTALIRRETITGSELAILRSLLAALGMTPADRAKLSVPTEKPKNKFAALAAEVRKVRPN